MPTPDACGRVNFLDMPARSKPFLGPRNIVVTIAVFAIALASCATTRPTVEEWQPSWDRVVAGIPAESVTGENPSRELCDTTLAFLRDTRPELSPTPDLAVDDTVKDWFDIAEDAFFECPPRSQQVGSFSDAYTLLARLQAEVDLVLDMDRGS